MDFFISIPWLVSVVIFFIIGWYLGNNRGYKKGVKDTNDDE